jgi:predicted Zn-dependent peptidase
MPNRTRISLSKDITSSYRKTTLPNGIRIVSEEIPYVKSVSIGMWVNTGSRYESVEENGISHFIEHMVFKGTTNRTTRDIAESLESVGGYLNAFTTKEHTCFYARVLDEHTPLAADVLSDLLQNPLFKTGEIQKEKTVVLEELKNVEDDPDDLIHDLFDAELFGGHPLSAPVLGTADNIRQFSRKQLLTFLKDHYLSSQIVVAAAGNLNHDRLVELIEKYFRLPLRESTPGKSFGIPSPQQKIKEFRKPIQQAHICMGTLSFSAKSKMRFPALILNTLLGDGMSSRLFQHIREKYGFAYSVYSFLNMLSDTGSMGVYIGTDTKHVERCLELIWKELTALKKKNVPPDELARTKSQLKGNTMIRLGSGEIYFGDFMPLDEILRRVESVTGDAVHDVAETVFQEKNFTTVVILPK